MKTKTFTGNSREDVHQKLNEWVTSQGNSIRQTRAIQTRVQRLNPKTFAPKDSGEWKVEIVYEMTTAK